MYLPKDRARAMTEAIVMILLQRARNLGAHIPHGMETWQHTQEDSLAVRREVLSTIRKAKFWRKYWALLLLYRKQQGSEWGKRGTTLRARDHIGGEPTQGAHPNSIAS